MGASPITSNDAGQCPRPRRREAKVEVCSAAIVSEIWLLVIPRRLVRLAAVQIYLKMVRGGITLSTTALLIMASVGEPKDSAGPALWRLSSKLGIWTCGNVRTPRSWKRVCWLSTWRLKSRLPYRSAAKVAIIGLIKPATNGASTMDPNHQPLPDSPEYRKLREMGFNEVRLAGSMGARKTLRTFPNLCENTPPA